MSITQIVGELRSEIKKLIKNNELVVSDVTLLAACKTQNASVIEEAILSGVKDFGENRVQEAEGKWPALKAAHPEVRLHLIGPLQTNKVKQAVALFDVIQSVDREKLAEVLAEEMNKAGRHLPCFIQVNIGKEEQKAGVMPEKADAFIVRCIHELKLPVVGLMCVPPHDKPAAPYFAILREMAKAHELKELSMGMSEDFRDAVRMGSTCVRLGRVLFGERQ